MHQNYLEFIFMKRAFTLTEVLIAVAIVGIIAALVLPKAIESYQIKTMEYGFNREVQTIEDSLNSLAVSENKADFFSTMMYLDSEPENYDSSSGMYLKKYLRASKMCKTPEDCFADKYYEYEAGKKRTEYKPDYKGACAVLKNGMSICLTPQIANNYIAGVLDMNGKKGPNIAGRDLREFGIEAKTRLGQNQDTEGVIKLDWENLVGDEVIEEDPPETDPCDTSPNSLACCKTKSSPTPVCCTYNEFKNHPNCKEDECTVTGNVRVVLRDQYHTSSISYQMNTLKYNNGKSVPTNQLKLIVNGQTYSSNYCPRYTCNGSMQMGRLMLGSTTLSNYTAFCFRGGFPYVGPFGSTDSQASWTFIVYKVKVPCN